MENENMVFKLKCEAQPKIYRFDIFKGARDEAGKVTKARSVGTAIHAEGQKTFKINLKTFLQDEFFLLPNTKNAGVDFDILTRFPSDNPNKKYLWNTVGEGVFLSGTNSGLMHLVWDLFATPDIFMNLRPKDVVSAENLAAGAA